MKKFLSVMLMLLLVLPLTAFAKKDPANTQNRVNAAKNEYREQLKSRKENLKQLHAKIVALSQENKELISQIKPMLKALKANRDDAAKAKLALIKPYHQTLSAKRAELKALKGSAKPAWEQFKSNMKNKNFVDALSNLDSITGIRTNRLELLTSINAALREITNILK